MTPVKRPFFGARHIATAAMLFLLAVQPALAESSGPGADLVGLWGSETIFGPKVRGPVVMGGSDAGWSARIAGFEASSDAQFRFVLPDGQGELDAAAPRVGRSLHGFWIQPSGRLGRFASPVLFSITWSPGPVLRSDVVPLDDRLSLYLNIRRADGDSLRGSFRSPEAGWNGGRPWFRIEGKGDRLELSDPTTGRVQFVLPYDSGRRQITMDFGAPVILTPRTADQALGYRPRPPSASEYAYRVPVSDGDGWQTASASSVGLDEGMFVALVRRIVAADPGEPDAPLIQSLLVARRGKLVLDEYFFGFTSERPHDLRSASKTFTGLMTGIAIDRGGFEIDTPVYSLLGADAGGQAGDARRSQITVAHLLTHSSGLACNDNDDDSPGNEDRMQQQRDQNDWYRFTLELPMAHDPGTTYGYCSGGINLLGAVIAKARGTSLLEFFDEFVAGPLEMRGWHMNLMPTGEAYAGGGIYMRPRDLLKLGQAFLDGGKWNGNRVVSKRWVEQSTRRQVDAPDGSADGYAWHLQPLEQGGRRWREYHASGNGGQLLIVLPELDTTVVFTAGNYNRYPIWRKFRDDLVPQYIIGAVKDQRR